MLSVYKNVLSAYAKKKLLKANPCKYTGPYLASQPLTSYMWHGLWCNTWDFLLYSLGSCQIQAWLEIKKKVGNSTLSPWSF